MKNSVLQLGSMFLVLVFLSSPARAQTLTITVPSRVVNSGATIQHTIRLTNYGVPLPGKTVYVEDPIGNMCTWVVTNFAGTATFSRSTTNPGPYTFRFMYGWAKVASTVAVKPSGSYVTLPSYAITLNSTSSSPSSSTLVVAERTAGAAYAQSFSTTRSQAIAFGKAVATDYFANPVSAGIFGATVVTCVSVPFTSGFTGPACAKLGWASAQGIAQSTVKVAAHQMVNSAYGTSSPLHTMIDAGDVVISVAKFKPTKGLEIVQSAELGWNVGSVAGNLIYSNSTLKGASLAGQLGNSDSVLQCTIYRR